MTDTKTLSLASEHYDKCATVYRDSQTAPKACLLYFHGGGLLYGSRCDLPEAHIDFLTKAGYAIVAYDYPLAPAAGIADILSDVRASVNDYLLCPQVYTGVRLPCFLWGRSAGAYLSLLTAAGGGLSASLAGVVSFYGYGLLCDGWFDAPSAFYLSLPRVDGVCAKDADSAWHAEGPLDTHYSRYVYARQTGTWLSLLYSGRRKQFDLDYTLRARFTFPCPLFCAHSLHDPDVPYAECTALTGRFPAERFLAPGAVHDFDRDEKSPETGRLLAAMAAFLEHCLA
ncbi:MAG: alpha/beta hydrolase [Lachnospiraceae bacterium]|nr:alpha/beta hydrolase [Lachnospiraceae bacterium]